MVTWEYEPQRSVEKNRLPVWDVPVFDPENHIFPPPDQLPSPEIMTPEKFFVLGDELPKRWPEEDETRALISSRRLKIYYTQLLSQLGLVKDLPDENQQWDDHDPNRLDVKTLFLLDSLYGYMSTGRSGKDTHGVFVAKPPALSRYEEASASCGITLDHANSPDDTVFERLTEAGKNFRQLEAAEIQRKNPQRALPLFDQVDFVNWDRYILEPKMEVQDHQIARVWANHIQAYPPMLVEPGLTGRDIFVNIAIDSLGVQLQATLGGIQLFVDSQGRKIIMVQGLTTFYPDSDDKLGQEIMYRIVQKDSLVALIYVDKMLRTNKAGGVRFGYRKMIEIEDIPTHTDMSVYHVSRSYSNKSGAMETKFQAFNLHECRYFWEWFGPSLLAKRSTEEG